VFFVTFVYFRHYEPCGRGKKMIAYLPPHISSLGTRLELDRRNNVRRAICVSNAQIVFPAQARDCHTLPVYMASALHHAHPRGRTAIGVRIIPSEADALPIHNLTSKSVSNQSSSKRIYANNKFHWKTGERQNGSA
jgi:hypothetical protein